MRIDHNLAVKQAVTFEDRINAAGVEQHASTLVGNDATGVNDGSKNSTLVNYVSDAWSQSRTLSILRLTDFESNRRPRMRDLLRGRRPVYHVLGSIEKVSIYAPLVSRY